MAHQTWHMWCATPPQCKRFHRCPNVHIQVVCYVSCYVRHAALVWRQQKGKNTFSKRILSRKIVSPLSHSPWWGPLEAAAPQTGGQTRCHDTHATACARTWACAPGWWHRTRIWSRTWVGGSLYWTRLWILLWCVTLPRIGKWLGGFIN